MGVLWYKGFFNKKGVLSSYEIKFISLINKYSLPLKFVGDGDFWITYKGKNMNPDFVSIDNSRIVVEVYSIYMRERNGCTEEEYKIERAEAFSSFGYKVICFNEHDLFRPDWEQHCLKVLDI